MRCSRTVTNSMVICVLLVLGAAAGSAQTGKRAKEDSPKGRININTADTAELALLPRVGPTVAQRIVDFREKNGRFKTSEDLLLVRGIGEKTFALIEPFVRVDGETTLKEKIRVPQRPAQAEAATES